MAFVSKHSIGWGKINDVIDILEETKCSTII
jgi:hypothetical protein